MSSLGNVQSYYNGYISACRNIFLTSSVAIVLYGFSNSFKTNSSVSVVRFSSTFVFLFALVYGFITVIGMFRYIRDIERSNEPMALAVQLDLWKANAYVVSSYLVLLLILSFAGLRRFMLYLNTQ